MSHTKTRNLILCALFAALIAVGAFIKIPIPLVPFTLQFLFVNLAGLLLGKRLATISVVAYIVLGLIGLPIFAAGGGPGYIFQPTFGYLLGFLLGAYLTGLVVEKRAETNFKTMMLASLVNLAAIYGVGMAYFWFITNYYIGSSIGVTTWLLSCLVLTIPGDFVLCLFSSKLAKRLYPIVNRGAIR